MKTEEAGLGARVMGDEGGKAWIPRGAEGCGASVQRWRPGGRGRGWLFPGPPAAVRWRREAGGGAGGRGAVAVAGRPALSTRGRGALPLAVLPRSGSPQVSSASPRVARGRWERWALGPTPPGRSRRRAPGGQGVRGLRGFRAESPRLPFPFGGN